MINISAQELIMFKESHFKPLRCGLVQISSVMHDTGKSVHTALHSVIDISRGNLRAHNNARQTISLCGVLQKCDFLKYVGL